MNVQAAAQQVDYDVEQLKAVQDLFNKVRGGTYIRYAFVTPEQLAAWSNYMKWPFYYASRNEPPLIPVASHESAKLIRPNTDVIGIENGPGTESGIRLKTIPYYEGIPNLRTLLGRDWSANVGEALKITGRNKLKGVERRFDLANFNRDPLPANLPQGQRVFAEFGFSRGNLEGLPEDGYPMDILEADAEHLISLMQEGDIFAGTIDGNTIEADIVRSYSPPVNDEWAQAQVRHMKETLPITGDLVPEDFRARALWHGESWLCTNNLIATRKMEFNVGGMDCVAHKGEPYPFTNMWKAPINPILDVYRSKGLQLKALPKDRNGWVHIPVFQR